MAVVIVSVGLTPVGAAAGADGAGSEYHSGSPHSLEQADGTTANVSAVEALRLVENVTNGTSVGLELEEGNVSPVYDVTVLQRNGVLMEVIVDAVEGRILTVTTGPGEVFEDEADEDDELGENESRVFGDEEQDSAGNLSADDVRSAVDAVTAARNASVGNRTVDPNATVTEVELLRNGSAYVYEVELRSPDGELTEVDVNETTGTVLSADGQR